MRLMTAVLFVTIALGQGGPARQSRNQTTEASGFRLPAGRATDMTATLTTDMSNSSSGTVLYSTGTAFVIGRSSDGFVERRKLPVPMPQLGNVKASARLISKTSLASASYVKVAVAIGLKSAGVDEAVALDMIDQLEIKVYSYKAVDEWLYASALKMGSDVRWVWKPLRDGDLQASRLAMADGSVNQWDVRAGFGALSTRLYGQAIPERVLNRVAAVLAKMPDAVFLISDYEVEKPDPFLAVTTKLLIQEGKLWIIDQWDEPGFRDETADSLTPAKL